MKRITNLFSGKRLPDSVKTFEPSKHISGFVPGKTRVNDVIKILGEPDKIEITEDLKLYGGMEIDGKKCLEYP